MRRHRLLALITALLLAAVPASVCLAAVPAAVSAQSAAGAGPAAPASPAVIHPADNLKTDGIPEIPASIAEAVGRYTEFRSPYTESEQMVATVKRNGGPVWYLLADDEGHGFAKKRNQDFQFYATVAFMKAHLLD